MERFILELQEEVLNKLAGKINLVHNEGEREMLVLGVLSEVCGNLESKVLLNKVKALGSSKERERFVKDFLSYGVIDDLLCDPDTEDIIINSLNPIFIHTSSRGLIKTDKRFDNQHALDIFIKKLIIFSGRTQLRRINNLELPNIEGRVNIVMSPLGAHITITKIKQQPLSIIDLIDKGTLTYEMAAQLWLYVEGLSVRAANIIISGGPGTGKTTLLNALFSFIPTNERIVVIEDTLELTTKQVSNCARLESDEDLSLEDLVKNSLRMRPERVIVGEVRGREAQDLMTAMNIGKYCMGTLHANSAREAILRLQSEPMNVPETLVSLINVFIIMRKYHIKDKVFRVVSEIVETAGIEQKKVLLSYLWGYDHAKGQFRATGPSSVYRDYLATLSGLSPRQIMDEISFRANLFKSLKEKGMHKIEDISKFCNLYNNDRQEAIRRFDLNFDEPENKDNP